MYVLSAGGAGGQESLLAEPADLLGSEVEKADVERINT